jgi:hypothetical protein
MKSEKSLQETYAPEGICFGCGVKNEKGLRIHSFPNGEEVTAVWHAAEHHQAFPGMLNGGIVGALLDCHSNWTAAYFLMKQTAKSRPTAPSRQIIQSNFCARRRSTRQFI